MGASRAVRSVMDEVGGLGGNSGHCVLVEA